jgi:hypothetical protein
MADLSTTHSFEAIIGDDLWRVEVLEFRRICAGLFRQADEEFRPFQIAIVIGSDIRDEIRWVIWANGSISKFDFHFVLR